MTGLRGRKEFAQKISAPVRRLGLVISSTFRDRSHTEESGHRTETGTRDSLDQLLRAQKTADTPAQDVVHDW